MSDPKTKFAELLEQGCHFYGTSIRYLQYLTPAIDLVLRLWVANVFFKSGLVKVQSFSSTIALFEYEYSVPLLPAELAAYLGTGVELFFPVLLVLGLAGRISALVLFVFNFVAAASYPDISAGGIEQHTIWGLMLLVTLLHGPGKLSLDYFIQRKFCKV